MELDPKALRALIDELRAGLRDVTPGPWMVYDGCSWRRIGTAHGRRDDCAVLAPTKASDGHPDLTCSRGNDRDANLAHIARCSPDNIAKLLDAAEAALTASRSGETGWRDMGSAPRDGTRVLITEDGEVAIAHFIPASGQWSNRWKPERWQPLPADPLPTQESSSG